MPVAIPKIVRTLSLFADLNEREKDNLLRQGKIRHCPKDQHLFVYGDEVTYFYIIGEGTVQLFRETPDGHEMTSDVLIAGDTIGETEILNSQSTHQFNAMAVEDSIVMEFPIVWLKESAKSHSEFALNLLAALSSRIHIATIEAEHKSTMSAAQQVACFLERLCILRDYDPHGFVFPYSKTLIASRLGMELETLSRALAKIREHGISVIDTRVSFDDVEKMENYVCGDCSISDNCKEHEALKALLHEKKSNQATCV